jgi:hypothetical protein
MTAGDITMKHQKITQISSIESSSLEESKALSLYNRFIFEEYSRP